MTNCVDEINQYLHRLFPIYRSLSGEGNRETLKVLQEIIPINIVEYPSGQKVYDWQIPKEWSIRDAWIKNNRGEKVVDLKDSNLHVMSYSSPIQKRLTWDQLEHHLHYLRDLPQAIPYRTSYYKEDWGFCLTYKHFQALQSESGLFEVLIDSEFNNGSMSIGEILIPGQNSKELLISTYICHPSLANDNLSGMILTTFLVKELLSRKILAHSYRIIFVPETIGAIAYCAMNEKAMLRIDAGLVVTTVGGPGKFGYKQSFNKNHPINRLIEQIFMKEGREFVTYPFDIHGSDERQYSSPGFRINMATICKDKYYEYPGYHNSLDNLDFVKAEHVYESLQIYLKLVDQLERQNDIHKERLNYEKPKSDSRGETFVNCHPNCEVMLSKRGLYPKVGGGFLLGKGRRTELDIILWLLFYCDGNHSTEEISQGIDIPLEDLNKIVKILEKKGLLKKISVAQP